ncbi:MFS transporter [Psychromicrobium xiongbiense]|uniref:MFS transporter n=1 Tax=Psychromicrobium xiongbiense TaxID=3051184 RepID=UPI002553098C|nr:MFS transporter [Psychromicrobium sp. YIM S02556]
MSTEPTTLSPIKSRVKAQARAQGLTGPATPTRYGFILAIAAQIMMMIGASAPSPFYPALAQRLGFDATMITTVFAVYAVALMLALLTAGSLSDHLGRRPVIIAGFLLLAVSMILFWNAGSVMVLILARLVQGLASGLLISALSAAVLDLAPRSRPGIAAIWNALCPGIGLSLGAFLSGIALDAAPDALVAVFAPLTVAYLAIAVLFFSVPETAPRLPGAWASLSFRLSLPAGIRTDFWRSAPAIVAGWATGGLFLSLGASIVRGELGGTAHFWQGLSVALLAGTGAVTALIIRHRSPRTITIFGTAALALGTALSLFALTLTSLPAYLIAVAVTGMGFGTAFFGVVGTLAPRIPATARADTFAAIFLLAYLAFGIPAVVAGLLVTPLGLGTVCLGYGAVVITLSLFALVLRLRRAA